MVTLDVRPYVAEFERVLRGDAPTAQCRDALAALERWQWDEMLDEPSRAAARRLLFEFRHALG